MQVANKPTTLGKTLSDTALRNLGILAVLHIREGQRAELDGMVNARCPGFTVVSSRLHVGTIVAHLLENEIV